MEQEVSYIRCKLCSKEVKRICVGKYPNGRDKKWMEEATFKLMNGMTCSTCHAEKQVKAQRDKKLARESKSNTEF